MPLKLDIVSVKVLLWVAKASTVRLETNAEGKTTFHFGMDPEVPDMEFRQVKADEAVARFLEAGTAHDFYRVFRTYGPLRRWSQETVTLDEVRAIQTTSRLMRERGTYKRICDLNALVEANFPAEVLEKGDASAVRNIPSFRASWQSPLKLEAECDGLLEALSCTLFLDKANDRDRIFCARKECGRTFLKKKGDKRIYCDRMCGVKVAKARLSAKKKKRAAK